MDTTEPYDSSVFSADPPSGNMCKAFFRNSKLSYLFYDLSNISLLVGWMKVFSHWCFTVIIHPIIPLQWLYTHWTLHKSPSRLDSKLTPTASLGVGHRATACQWYTDDTLVILSQVSQIPISDLYGGTEELWTSPDGHYTGLAGLSCNILI